MKRPEPNPPVVETPDADATLAYAALAAVEDLDALEPATGGEGVPLLGEAAAAAVEDLELVGELEDADWTGMTAEGEDALEPLAHRYEGVDLDEIDALAHFAEGAEASDEEDDERTEAVL